MRTFLRRLTIPAIFLMLLAGGYGLYRLVGTSDTLVPDDFTNARAQGAFIAQAIVATSNDLSGNLSRVEELERARNYTEALVLTSELAKQTVEIRTRAVQLSRELELMTRTVPSIESSDARAKALEAIGNHLALISHLINYSDGLLQLVDALRGRFTGTHTEAQVATLIASINEEVRAVNELNDKATEALGAFDAIVN